MNTFDLFSMAELTASAAVIVFLLVSVLGSTLRQRTVIAAALAGWFLSVLIIGVNHVFTPGEGIGVIGLGLGVVIPVALLSLLILGTAGGRQRLQHAPLFVLVGVHGIRLLGVSFLLLRAAQRLPAPFAPTAGWGDIVVAVLALPTAFVLWRAQQSQQTGPSHAWLLLWNTLGLADLVIALFLGASSSPGPLQLFHVTPSAAIMTTLPWILIPSFLVPSLILLHICIYYRLAWDDAHSRSARLAAASVAAS